MHLPTRAIIHSKDNMTKTMIEGDITILEEKKKCNYYSLKNRAFYKEKSFQFFRTYSSKLS